MLLLINTAREERRKNKTEVKEKRKKGDRGKKANPLERCIIHAHDCGREFVCVCVCVCVVPSVLNSVLYCRVITVYLLNLCPRVFGVWITSTLN